MANSAYEEFNKRHRQCKSEPIIIAPYLPVKLFDFQKTCVEMLVLAMTQSKGSDCKSDGSAFAGSNPAPSK